MLGFVDEPLATGGDEHLTEAIVEDITRQRVGEMRQIISTITPEQYELISRARRRRARHPGRPGHRQDRGRAAPGRVAAVRRSRSSRARACSSSARTATFIAYIEQVLPALGEQSVEQRPIDALVSRPPLGRSSESDERATLLGQRADGRGVLARLLWDRVGPPARRPARIEVARVGVGSTPADVAELIAEARERLSYERGPRALPRAARGPRSRPRSMRRSRAGAARSGDA